MKKLLLALTSFGVFVTPTLDVVSCTNTNDYKQIINWINAKDSFVLFLGTSDSSSVTSKFKELLNNQKVDNNTSCQDWLNQCLKETMVSYNKNNTSDNNEKDPIRVEMGYGETIKSLDFHILTEGNASGFWSNNASMKKLDTWLQNELLNMTWSNDGSKPVNDNIISLKDYKNQIKSYVESITGPLLLVIRNGKFVSMSSVSSSPSNTKDSINTFVKSNVEDVLKDQNRYMSLVNAIRQKTSLKSDYKMNYNVDWNNYVK